jgi:HK97 family phage portal protein
MYVFAPSKEQALGIAAVYRCVQLLSDSVAGLQLQYLRRKDDRYLEDEGSAFHYLLSVQPQPEMSIFDFWSEAVKQILLDGNAYIYPRRVLGEVTDLVLCHRNTVAHDVLNGKYTICDPYNAVYGTFGESEIIHLYIHSSDGRHGESVISHARRTLTIAAAGDDETANRFANGGNVRGIVSNDKSAVGFGEYQDDELEKTATDIDGKFRSGDRIVSLPGQVDFKQISLSSTDMQFLESRKFTVREVCRFFGVHPSFVFDDTSTNYKSAESANVAFLSMTLDPILKRIEAEFTRKLIPQSLCCKRIFRFDRRGVYSLDLEAKADYQKKTIESGVYTVNDWRHFENQPSVEGGDTVYVSTNLAPLGSNKLAGGNAE